MIRKTKRAGRSVLVIDIPYQTPDGEHDRYRRDAQVQTRTAAEAEHRRLLTELQTTGRIGGASKASQAEKVFTFDDAEKLYRSLTLPTKKPSTSNGYLEILDGALAPKLKGTPITKIDKAMLATIDAQIATSELSSSRRRNIHVVYRGILRTAVVHGMLSTFPELPNLPKVGRKEEQPLVKQQVEAVLSVASSTARVAFALAAYAGLRRGEIQGLRWGDVDLKAKTITVRRSITAKDKETPRSPDTNESSRWRLV